MNKKETKRAKETKRVTKDNRRGFGLVELLFAAATIGAAVLVAVSRGPKLPPASCD